MTARVKPPDPNPFRFGRIVSGDAFTYREADLPVLEVIPVGSSPAAPAPDGERKPAGMSLPMA